MLPYHLGVMDTLQEQGLLTSDTPICGASAGAIAAATHGVGIDSKRALQDTIDISNTCAELGGARGKLLPLLREKLFENIGEEEMETLKNRKGEVGIVYQEVLPFNRPVFETKFDTETDLINAVLHSSTFPFFSSNWPFALDTHKRKFPRIVVDGFFTVPRSRMGCPDFAHGGVEVDEEVLISCFPLDTSGGNVICPDKGTDVAELLETAMEASSAETLIKVYEAGLEDAERWYREQFSKRKDHVKVS